MRGHFNTVHYKNRDEFNTKHFKAKLRIKHICEKNFCGAWLEVQAGPHFLEGWREPKTYSIDVFAKHLLGDEREYCIEVDGLSHSKHRRQVKDKDRDEYFRSIGIKVIRFDIDEVIGRFALTDEEIKQRIYH